MLHITNGTSVSIKDAGIGGDVLAWNDVLHEGPVPSGLPLERLSEQRAGFIAGRFEIDPAEVRRDFAQRDQRLRAAGDDDEVVLWFEHDLYDQLQLLQVLDHFARAPHRCVTLIQSDTYLGPMHGHELAALFPRRRPVRKEQLQCAQDAWAAFRSPVPTVVAEQKPTLQLPYLQPAFRRLLEEYPSASGGLGRTQRQFLTALERQGPLTLREAFLASQASEDAIFLGDSGFFAMARELAACRRPLILLDGETANITDAGREALAGKADHVKRNGIDRWFGGVHLTPSEVWRWDGSKISRS